MRVWVPSLALLSTLRIWRCCMQQGRSQMHLRSSVAVAVVQACSCSSTSSCGPGTSTCRRCGWFKKRERERKKRNPKVRTALRDGLVFGDCLHVLFLIKWDIYRDKNVIEVSVLLTWHPGGSSPKISFHAVLAGNLGSELHPVFCRLWFEHPWHFQRLCSPHMIWVSHGGDTETRTQAESVSAEFLIVSSAAIGMVQACAFGGRASESVDNTWGCFPSSSLSTAFSVLFSSLRFPSSIPEKLGFIYPSLL